MSTPHYEGDQTDEKIIVVLVNKVREIDCEEAFDNLRNYLNSYIKLFEHKYRIPGCDADEIEQECLYALRFKAIEDFNPARGKFRSFAILCMKRHLFSIIKASSQQKRRVLNESLSLDEDRSEGNELSLSNLVTKDTPSAVEVLLKEESNAVIKERLVSKLSRLEAEVLTLYLAQCSYEEIVQELKKIFPNKELSKKVIDNSLVRTRLKSRTLDIGNEFFNEK